MSIIVGPVCTGLITIESDLTISHTDAVSSADSYSLIVHASRTVGPCFLRAMQSSTGIARPASITIDDIISMFRIATQHQYNARDLDTTV
jgi:hypothetical protein